VKDIRILCSTLWPEPYSGGMASPWGLTPPAVVERCIIPVDSDPKNRKLYVTDRYWTRDPWCLERICNYAHAWCLLRRDRHWIATQGRQAEA
jgi:hypothetical protein